MRTAAIIAVMFFVGFPAFVFGQATSVERPTWSVGDTWEYRSGNNKSSWAVIGVTSDSYVVQSIGEDGQKSIEHFDHNLLFDKAYWFHPNWPLVEGKQWQFPIQATSTGGANSDYSVTETVVGGESVTVPAGVFQAVRIHGKQCNLTLGGCGDFDVWYAPEAKWTVKIARTGTYWSQQGRTPRELVSYHVAK